MAPLLLQISYDKTEGTHNLICLIRTVAAYTTCYGADFAEPACVRAYDTIVDDDTTYLVFDHIEAAHKSKRDDCGTYKIERRETAQFILDVIEDTWVQELRDTETFYTNVAPKALLVHL